MPASRDHNANHETDQYQESSASSGEEYVPSEPEDDPSEGEAEQFTSESLVMDIDEISDREEVMDPSRGKETKGRAKTKDKKRAVANAGTREAVNAVGKRKTDFMADSDVT